MAMGEIADLPKLFKKITPSNGVIVKIVLCDLDLRFKGKMI